MKKETKLQKCWVWNDKVSDFVKERVKGYSLNICAGLSKIGDVRVDLDPEDRSVIKGDFKKLKFKDNTFDTVISDPPWKIGYYDRWKPFFESVRVCKVGGTIIYNAYWIPEAENTELVECYVRSDQPFTNASVLAVFKKNFSTPDRR